VNTPVRHILDERLLLKNVDENTGIINKVNATNNGCHNAEMVQCGKVNAKTCVERDNAINQGPIGNLRIGK
jgi:hypothetical protein